MLLMFAFELYGQVGLYATKNINYKEIIEPSFFDEKQIDEKTSCVLILKDELSSKKYIAKHYIPKGSIICSKSVEEYKKEAVKFNFGSFEIETEGKIVFENDEFVKIKKLDGSIEKIFKNGLDR